MTQDSPPLDANLMLALNNTHAEEASELDLAGLNALLATACYVRGTDQGATALLIALDHNANYDNLNFAWFRSHYESFIYVDRVIVAAFLRGRGVARRLYEELFTLASQAGHSRVVCEVNLDPPNPASLAFHQTMGFEEVGQATIHNGTKTVRYLTKPLGESLPDRSASALASS